MLSALLCFTLLCFALLCTPCYALSVFYITFLSVVFETGIVDKKVQDINLNNDSERTKMKLLLDYTY